MQYYQVTFPVRGSRILHRPISHSTTVLLLPLLVQDELVQYLYTCICILLDFSAIMAVSIRKQYAFSRNTVRSNYVQYYYTFELSVYSDQVKEQRILAMRAN